MNPKSYDMSWVKKYFKEDIGCLEFYLEEEISLENVAELTKWGTTWIWDNQNDNESKFDVTGKVVLLFNLHGVSNRET